MCIIQCLDLICAPFFPLQVLSCHPCFFLLCSVSLCASDFCACMDVEPCAAARVVFQESIRVSDFCVCMDIEPCTFARVVFQEPVPKRNEFSSPSSC